MITENDAYAVYELLNNAKNIMKITERYPISAEQIVKIAEACGQITMRGKLDLYYHLLLEGAREMLEL